MDGWIEETTGVTQLRIHNTIMADNLSENESWGPFGGKLQKLSLIKGKGACTRRVLRADSRNTGSLEWQIGLNSQLQGRQGAWGFPGLWWGYSWTFPPKGPVNSSNYELLATVSDFPTPWKAKIKLAQLVSGPEERPGPSGHMYWPFPVVKPGWHLKSATVTVQDFRWGRDPCGFNKISAYNKINS